ncbi:MULTISPECIES: protein translocase subunit SecD [unclassified Luteimonas]|uniref:protein translocase subunit SecD n=1 Tax=unclassified Luteimonas TaxID=2629088 RepID=UPI0018F0F44B|nr:MULTISPECIES: protein translocase subunit SecD [unclassified Luteimonas]MBJ6978027.1 protein translocase subunit SecD [Luteimonas sp. MC1895]MBJ6984847.1 protein translocase subunit SecD [Luteimonas sp. MC1750]QQO07059.1 protein translocase subunit SecD [Luteimonas sp. MC1750]
MLEFPRWKYVTILLVVLLATLYALPNIYPQDPSVQITSNRGAATGVELDAKIDQALSTAGVTPKSVDTEGEGERMVRLLDLDDQTRAADALRPVLGEDYVVALNLASTVPDWLSWFGAKPMLLGLDLQGGVHFVLQVDQKAALDKRLDAYADEVRAILRDNRIRYESVERNATGTTVAQLSDAADANRAMTLLATAQPTLLREAVGSRITIRVPETELNQISADAIDQNITTLRNRVDEVGVGEPVITRQGNDRVVVQLPGVQDTAEAKRMIGATATLEYRAVIDGDPYDAVASGSVPPEARVYYRRETGIDGKPIPVLLSKRVIASGEQMVAAQSTLDENGMPAVSVTLNNLGGQRMFDFTTVSVGKPMAVVYIERVPQVTTNAAGEDVRSFRVSEEVISVANINGVFGKQFQTTGLEKAEADGLARLLRSGSLAAPMDFIEERIVGPSLGKENVARGTTAVLYAFVFTLLFFGIYYRMFGLFTCVALLLNLLMVVAIMSVFNATMSLPGFAGLALSIGMSVDANVLINERIREELRAGMPPRAAIANGYDKASGTIFDSNMTALLAGIALFAFGTGPLKGFAVTMVIGILTSVFTAVTVSRGIATLVYGGKRKLKTLAI